MIQCSACGTVIRHSWNGHYDPETGEYTCNGCYEPALHRDPNSDWLLDAGTEDEVQ